MARPKIVIMGAAGRDFHNFNVLVRDNEDYEVVAFTATQIPDIEGPDLSSRSWPAPCIRTGFPFTRRTELEGSFASTTSTRCGSRTRTCRTPTS